MLSAVIASSLDKLIPAPGDIVFPLSGMHRSDKDEVYEICPLGM